VKRFVWILNHFIYKYIKIRSYIVEEICTLSKILGLYSAGLIYNVETLHKEIL